MFVCEAASPDVVCVCVCSWQMLKTTECLNDRMTKLPKDFADDWPYGIFWNISPTKRQDKLRHVKHQPQASFARFGLSTSWKYKGVCCALHAPRLIRIILCLSYAFSALLPFKRIKIILFNFRKYWTEGFTSVNIDMIWLQYLPDFFQ